MMEEYEKVLKSLTDWNIQYKLIEHPPALTIEDADRYIEGIEGVRTKTLFLCNKKSKAYYLVILDDSKQIEMKKLEELLAEKGLHFCSPEKLMNKLKLSPGIVSVFGLLNNEERDVNVIIDEEMMEEEFVSFHVNDNRKTAFITSEDMVRFITKEGFAYRILKL